MTVVCQTVANDLSQSVARSVGGFHDKLCLSVAIQVIGDKGHVVGPGADVDTHVYTPEKCAVKTVAVEEGRPGITIVGIIVGIGGIPFQNDLILSVAIDISYRSVVGTIGESLAIWGSACSWFLKFKGQVAMRSICFQCETTVAATTTYLIGGISSQWLGVDKEGASFRKGSSIKLLSVAENIEWLSNSIC